MPALHSHLPDTGLGGQAFLRFLRKRCGNPQLSAIFEIYVHPIAAKQIYTSVQFSPLVPLTITATRVVSLVFPNLWSIKN